MWDRVARPSSHPVRVVAKVETLPCQQDTHGAHQASYHCPRVQLQGLLETLILLSGAAGPAQVGT